MYKFTLTIGTYDANGNRSAMTYANDVTTNYTYDTCNRLTGETVTEFDYSHLLGYNENKEMRINYTWSIYRRRKENGENCS